MALELEYVDARDWDGESGLFVTLWLLLPADEVGREEEDEAIGVESSLSCSAKEEGTCSGRVTMTYPR